MLYDPWRCEADTEKGLQKAGNEGLFTDFTLSQTSNATQMNKPGKYVAFFG